MNAKTLAFFLVVIGCAFVASGQLLEICLLQIDSGNDKCGKPQTRWAYDPILKECREFQYNGCGGNRNNFATKQECALLCIRIL